MLRGALYQSSSTVQSLRSANRSTDLRALGHAVGARRAGQRCRIDQHINLVVAGRGLIDDPPARPAAPDPWKIGATTFSCWAAVTIKLEDQAKLRGDATSLRAD
jgi:hypothetical protein